MDDNAQETCTRILTIHTKRSEQRRRGERLMDRYKQQGWRIGHMDVANGVLTVIMEKDEAP